MDIWMDGGGKHEVKYLCHDSCGVSLLNDGNKF